MKSLELLKSFTLAEVLITLGIIGVVAGMTVPTLMQNIQDNQFKTQMRKEYSVLSNAYQLLVQENGGQFIYALSGCSASGHNCFKDVFKQKLSYVKECTSSSDPCVPNSSVKYLSGSPSSGVFTSTSSFGLILKDGAAVDFFLDSPSCMLPRGTYPNDCGWIVLDVNGIQPPNTWGRDIYVFFVFADTLRPSIAGVTIDSPAADDCKSNSGGITCSSKYLLGN